MPESLTVLGIESSCDETAVAILRSAGEEKAPEILSSVISSQIAIHRQHGGVVPELASRNHSADLPGIIRTACREAGTAAADIDVFGATGGPGLVAALLVGNSTAKALALAAGRPFVSVNHLEGHLLSPFLKRPGGPVPHLGMVVSGGHTLFVDVRGVGDYRLLGRSLDDAAGEAFDKVGKMLGLPYPGGPVIDRLAKEGNPKAFRLAHPHVDGYDYSFSGLKTSFLYMLRDAVADDPDFIERNKADLCASLQGTIVEILLDKLVRASKDTGIRDIAIAGGVSANSGLRNGIVEQGLKRGWRTFLPEFKFTTDNAAMIAMAGYYHYQHGDFSSLDVSPVARLEEL
mgnify:CR=1 FL=1